MVVVLAGHVLPAGRPTGPGQVAHLVLPGRWAAVMTIAGAAPGYQDRTLLPVLGKVTATRYTATGCMVRLVSGRSR